MTLATIVEALQSRKGVALFVSAVLLVSVTLAIGQDQSARCRPPWRRRRRRPRLRPPRRGRGPWSQRRP